MKSKESLHNSSDPAPMIHTYIYRKADVSNNDIRVYSKPANLSEQFDSDGQLWDFGLFVLLIGRLQGVDNVEDVLDFKFLFREVCKRNMDGSDDLNSRAVTT